MSAAETPHAGAAAHAVDDVNHRYWRAHGVVQTYAARTGWLDAGERAVLLRVSDDVRGRPVLDIGVGGGRTIPLLRLLTRDYTGIDYSGDMADACRRRFLDCDLRCADARDLSEFPGERFALAYFSYNGIDSIVYSERPKVLREVRRVLAPDGYFVFSTINYDGPLRRDRPWNLRPPSPVRPLGYARHVVKRARALPRNYRNYRRLKGLSYDASTHALAPGAGDFSFLVHFTTVRAALADLAAAGYGAVEVYASHDGRRIEPGEDTSSEPWLYYVARRNLRRRRLREASRR